MSEQLRGSPELRETKLYGRTSAEWHDVLTGDDLATPASRYGRSASGCAWWAVAALHADAEFGGAADEPEMAASYYMSAAVNDHPAVEGLVKEARQAIPDEVWKQLELEGELVCTLLP